MKTYIDTTTGLLFTLEDTQSLEGMPTTLEPYAPPPALLATTQTTRNAVLTKAYYDASEVPIAFTASASVGTYATDASSISSLQSVLLAFAPPASLPVGFYWVAQDNTKVPFTYADVQALSLSIGARNFALFSRLQDLKAQVRAALTPEAVALIVW